MTTKRIFDNTEIAFSLKAIQNLRERIFYLK